VSSWSVVDVGSCVQVWPRVVMFTATRWMRAAVAPPSFMNSRSLRSLAAVAVVISG